MAYRIEYARSNRSGCKGPKPCAGTKIDKGELRLGVVVEIRGERSMYYRHWGCVTEKIVSNLQDKIGDAEDLDGYEDLNEQDQERVQEAFKEGHIRHDEVTPVLLQKEEEAAAVASQKAAETPEKKVKGKGKKKRAAEEDEDGDDDYEAPKAKKAPAKKKKTTAEKASIDDQSEVATPKAKAVKQPRGKKRATQEVNGNKPVTIKAKGKGKKKANDVETPAEAPLDATTEAPADIGETAQTASKAPVKPKAPKKPRKSKATQEAATTVEGATVTPTAEGTSSASATPAKPPKKRGRPSKMAAEGDATVLATANEESANAEAAVENNTATANDGLKAQGVIAEASQDAAVIEAPKKRKQHKKRKAAAAEAGDEIEIPVVKRKRGRPRKEKPIRVPKKIGRPRIHPVRQPRPKKVKKPPKVKKLKKPKHDNVGNTSGFPLAISANQPITAGNNAFAFMPTIPKKRGRPRKPPSSRQPKPMKKRGRPRKDGGVGLISGDVTLGDNASTTTFLDGTLTPTPVKKKAPPLYSKIVNGIKTIDVETAADGSMIYALPIGPKKYRKKWTARAQQQQQLPGSQQSASQSPSVAATPEVIMSDVVPYVGENASPRQP